MKKLYLVSVDFTTRKHDLSEAASLIGKAPSPGSHSVGDKRMKGVSTFDYTLYRLDANSDWAEDAESLVIKHLDDPITMTLKICIFEKSRLNYGVSSTTFTHTVTISKGVIERASRIDVDVEISVYPSLVLKPPEAESSWRA